MRHLHHVALLALAWTASARAHAPVELARFVAFAPELVFTTNRGIVYGSLAHGDFRIVCAESLNLGLDGSYQLAQPRPGLWLLASEAGLFRSEDHGCSWSQDTNVPSFDLLAAGDALFLAAEGGLLTSDDQGAHWRTLLTLTDETITSLIATPKVLFAASYAGGAHFLLRSRDRGAHWERVPVALEDGERNLTLLAADDSQLIARASARRPELGERILRSQDDGASFELLGTLRIARAAALGDTTYLAGVDGVFELVDAELVQLGASAWVSALEVHDGSLLACGYYDGIDVPRNGIGALQADGFHNWFSFAEVSAPPACLATRCAAPVRDYTLENAMFERPPRTPPAEREAGVPAPVTPLLDASAPLLLDATPADARAAAAQHDAGCTLHDTGCSGWLALLALRRRRQAQKLSSRPQPPPA